MSSIAEQISQAVAPLSATAGLDALVLESTNRSSRNSAEFQLASFSSSSNIRGGQSFVVSIGCPLVCDSLSRSSSLAQSASKATSSSVVLYPSITTANDPWLTELIHVAAPQNSSSSPSSLPSSASTTPSASAIANMVAAASMSGPIPATSPSLATHTSVMNAEKLKDLVLVHRAAFMLIQIDATGVIIMSYNIQPGELICRFELIVFKCNFSEFFVDVWTVCQAFFNKSSNEWSNSSVGPVSELIF
jgi:hypothetical protein